MSIKRQAGVTLIELILFILIIGIALAAILGVMNVTTRNSADPARTKQALMIAEGLLEEVQLARFTKCDPSGDVDASGNCTIPEAWGQVAPEPVGPRPYDNVNDYVAAANTATPAFNVGSVLSDANGRALNVNGYTATVTITPDSLGPSGSVVGAGGSAADTDLLRIRITVFFDSRSLTLDGYRARYAPGI
ncbi:MAG: prepilin-type N-terminal cleavage/methylation domain-containing protein [Pseudomonadota bacterium]|nr:prepilin-type N-terminal cleavage/methylation domain-containing protein [Pseudomonadota bacterium]